MDSQRDNKNRPEDIHINRGNNTEIREKKHNTSNNKKCSDENHRKKH